MSDNQNNKRLTDSATVDDRSDKKLKAAEGTSLQYEEVCSPKDLVVFCCRVMQCGIDLNLLVCVGYST